MYEVKIYGEYYTHKRGVLVGDATQFVQKKSMEVYLIGLRKAVGNEMSRRII